jgi:hypothetical protein
MFRFEVLSCEACRGEVVRKSLLDRLGISRFIAVKPLDALSLSRMERERAGGDNLPYNVSWYHAQKSGTVAGGILA